MSGACMNFEMKIFFTALLSYKKKFCKENNVRNGDSVVWRRAVAIWNVTIWRNVKFAWVNTRLVYSVHTLSLLVNESIWMNLKSFIWKYNAFATLQYNNLDLFKRYNSLSTVIFSLSDWKLATIPQFDEIQWTFIDWVVQTYFHRNCNCDWATQPLTRYGKSVES